MSQKLQKLNKYFLIALLCLQGCAFYKLPEPQCLFPDQNLEQGGLINIEFFEKYTESSILKNSLVCYEKYQKRLISPIPYHSNKNIYKKSGFELLNIKFRESRLKIKNKKFNKISNENLLRIQKESDIYKLKLSSKSLFKGFDLPLKIPVAGIISSEYGVKRFINNIPKNPHLGMDIAAKIGTPIYAAASGIVILADDFFYRGKNILISHGYNTKTSYSHLDEITINEGQTVRKGQLIGYVGSSGRVTGAHLHFEIIFLGERLNPQIFFN